MNDLSSAKTEGVYRSIRNDIVRGNLFPGSQLSTWDVLEARFSVGRATLMRAMSRLKREGFICADSTRGTYVAERPPHLARYALAFQSHPGSTSGAGWNRFWKALINVVTEITPSEARQVALFFDVVDDNHSADYKRLVDDVIEDRLAGVIFVGPIGAMCAQLLQISGVPKVAISSVYEAFEYPRVYVDFDSFMEKACVYLASRGRKRVAVLTPYNSEYAVFERQIVKHGMTTKPFWQLPFVTTMPNAAFAATRLLLDSGHAERPDALVVCEDNMVESAMAAVVDSGMRVPQDLEIVTHCNWQAPVSTVLATRRLGFDAKAILDISMDSIDGQRKSKKPQLWTTVSATFENEQFDQAVRARL